jgi:hypothetical protein
MDSGCPDAGIPATHYVLTGPFEFDGQLEDDYFRSDLINVFEKYGIIQGNCNVLSDREIKLLKALK